jgi:hypothetical protein
MQPDIAKAHLGRCLYEGALTLVLGSGVSSGMGFPCWPELVQRCAEEAKIPDVVVDRTTPNAELLRIVDRVERAVKPRRDYHNLVMRCLYREVSDERNLITLPLLSVLGAMTMQSKRGSVREVLTFNFDDLLERYIRIHGFAGEIVHRLPCLRRDADVTVYHPHGFLPSPGSAFDASDFLIFSKYSFDERLGEQLEPWTELSRDLLLRKVALFVGLSIEGPNLGPLLINVAKRLPQPRPTGIWLIGPRDATDTEEQLLEWNIAPVRLPDYSDYPWFLLGVCQAAAQFF